MRDVIWGRTNDAETAAWALFRGFPQFEGPEDFLERAGRRVRVPSRMHETVGRALRCAGMPPADTLNFRLGTHGEASVLWHGPEMVERALQGA